MAMYLFKYGITILGLGTGLLLGPVEVPFIYYYSTSDGYFIVERADGTDSYVLTSYQLGDDEFLVGDGWSPSGEWFVWASIKGGSGYSRSAYLVSDSGYNIIEVPIDGTLLDLKWSPNADKLLIAHSSNVGWVIKIFDVELDNLIIKNLDLTVHYQRSEWNKDGTGIISYYEEYGVDTFSLLSDQLVTEQVVTYYDPCSSTQLSPADVRLYIEPQSKQLLIYSSSKTEFVDLYLEDQVLRMIDWSLDGQYALVYVASNCTDWEGSAYLLYVEDKSVWNVSSEVYISGYEDILSINNLRPINMWNSASTYASLMLVQGEVRIINIADNTLEVVPLSTNSLNNLILWSNTDDTLYFDWDQSILSYNPTTKLITTIVDSAEGNYITFFSISPDQQYVAYSYSTSCSQLCIKDLKNNIEIAVQMPKQAGINKILQYSLWHPTKTWLFVISTLPHFDILISNSKGTTVRNLTACTGTLSKSCFGWMPN